MRRLAWPTGGLWRHPDFLKLWSAETVSQFGTQVSLLALPLAAVIVLDATAFQVAALGTVEFLPFILFTLPAGVWVDRLPRRPILIAGDFGRAALLASIPLAYLTGNLTLGQLYVVGFLTGYSFRRSQRPTRSSRTRRASSAPGSSSSGFASRSRGRRRRQSAGSRGRPSGRS